MKRIILVLIIVVFSFLLFAGCSSRVQESLVVEEGESVSGGDDALGENMNMKGIEAKEVDGSAVLEFSFVNGSRLSDVPESKVSSVPQYTVTVLPAPARVRLDVKMGFWDYTQQEEVLASSFLYGIFQSKMAKGDMVSVYLQLTGKASVGIVEQEEKLMLTVTPVVNQPGGAYYTTLDAFNEYEQGLVPAELGYTPSLCEGLASVTLISPPFETQEEADAFVLETNDAIAESVPNRQAYALWVEANKLPQAKKTEETPAVVGEQPVFESDDTQDMAEMPVLVENGKYLCTTPDGDIIYARAYLPDTAQDEEYVLKEELWSIAPDGTHTQMEIRDFYEVEKAASSADGRYLAILDTGVSDRLLYVYDSHEEELHNLGEEGFGDNTTSFVWDKQQNIIYAMTGYGTLQLTKYDFSLPEMGRITSVEEKNGADSNLALVGGELYFADSAAGESGLGEIYCVDIENASRETVAQGIDFVLSPDGRYLVALVPVPDDEESMAFDLMLYDLLDETGEEGETVAIAKNIFLEKGNYTFGAQADTLYYTTTTYDGVSEEYPFAFLKCVISVEEDGLPQFSSSLLGYSKTGKFVPGSEAKELYVIDYFMQNNYNFCVTYVFRDK
ncbi:hypothetical protein LJC56_07720 [Christensenellaceae bacterium OttesenSCG-928-K19]|nr:hypothetical protein [Christensenellaceae bacterium OttesenSCG-928-K19]